MDVTMPQLGETVAEGKIVSWFKKVGDVVTVVVQRHLPDRPMTRWPDRPMPLVS